MIADKLVEAALKKIEDLLKLEQPSSNNRLRVLDIEVDVASGNVWRGDAVIDLPELSFRLLVALATQAPAMVDKDRLIADVWGDVVVSDETLAQRVRLLRQALDDDSQNPRYIAAVRGRGYRLAAPVEVLAGDRAGSDANRRHWWPGAAVTLVFVIGLVLFLAMSPREEATRPSLETVAVLPFVDFSESRSFGHFADGMQEELLSRLAGLGEIAVLSRTSVERFRDTSTSIPEISRSLAGTIHESFSDSDHS